MNKIIDFYKKKKIENEINYQMKSNIENNYFNLNQIKDEIQNKLNNQSKEINELISLISKNENIIEQYKIKNIKKNDNNNIINRKENNNFQNFK